MRRSGEEEQLLWHGTSRVRAEKIAEQGFKQENSVYDGTFSHLT